MCHRQVSGDDALADLDLDLHELFPTTSDKGDRDFRIEKKWFPLRYDETPLSHFEFTTARSPRAAAAAVGGACLPVWCSKPGALDGKKETTAADLKRGSSKDAKGGYGHMQLTLIFRPVGPPPPPPPTMARNSHRPTMASESRPSPSLLPSPGLCCSCWLVGGLQVETPADMSSFIAQIGNREWQADPPPCHTRQPASRDSWCGGWC